ncbi:MAG: portal protein [Dongiaceae bacterium]
MTESELKSINAAEIADSLGYLGGELSEQRRKALRYYLGEPFGNEQEGRSKVVSTDVADTIEWILPSLLKVFTAGDEVVRFEPTGPEDEEVAKQATEYVNWIFMRDNPGFLTLYTLFKDALLQKNGIAKVWWEEGETAARETYRRQSFEELQLLLADPDVEPIEHGEYQETGIVTGPDGLPAEGVVTLHDVTVKRKRRSGAVRIGALPPEEFLISRRARGIEDAAFVGHRLRKTASELIELGYDLDLVDRLPGAEEEDPTGERRERLLQDESGGATADGLNRAMREVWLTECYIKCDWDGDGIAERRKVTVGGGGQEILDNEPWDGPLPFISLTPIIMPHRFFGLSVAELVMDLQLIKSTILRQILDNLYLSNNGRHVISDQVNLDDLLTARPGGIVRLKNGAMPGQGHILPIDTPLVAAQAFPMLEYIDGVRENRTGVTRYNQGLAADTLNKTATGLNQIMGAAQQRIELIARVFAETGVKDLFRKILELVNRHQNAPRIIRLRNRWVPMDPRSWNSQMDVSITVGLGTGNKDQMLMHLKNLLDIQVEAIRFQGGVAGPLVTLENVYNTLARLVENAGLKSADPYFSDPAQRPPAPPPPQPPDPTMLALREQARLAAARLELDRQRAAADQAMDHARLAANIALKRDELALRARQAGLA